MTYISSMCYNCIHRNVCALSKTLENHPIANFTCKEFDRETGTRQQYEGKSLGEIEYALEKQEEVMVKWRIFPFKETKPHGGWSCSVCYEPVNRGDLYCSHCGQKLKWRKAEEYYHLRNEKGEAEK